MSSLKTSDSGLEIQIVDGVLVVGLNFNENNRMNVAAFEAFGACFDRYRDAPEVRAAVLRSARTGFFTNGLDPAMFLDQPRDAVRSAVAKILEATGKFCFFPAPTVIALGGHAMGAGAVFALAADYRIMAARGARIGFPEAAIAMNFPSFAAKLLTDLVGAAKARDLLFSAEFLKGPEALAAGLVDAICAPEELDAAALAAARRYADMPFGSSRGIKKALREPYREFSARAAAGDLEDMVAAILTANAQEGFRSIQEKRRPRFQIG